MKIVNLSEAKSNPSRYVSDVRTGGRVRVAVRGRPVVELVRIEELEPRDDWESEIEALVRRGVVRTSRVRPGTAKELLRRGRTVRGGASSPARAIAG